MRFWVPALLVIAVSSAGAHHPFAPYYDASKPTSVTGVIADLRVSNPHVVLIIDAQEPGGRSRRWAFEGYPPNVFRIQGVKDLSGRLPVGMRITISGWPATDPNAQAFSGRDITFPDGSTLRFGRSPDDGDGWHCSSGPCEYKYPDVR